jgi:Na+/H+ antiporter NhaA
MRESAMSSPKPDQSRLTGNSLSLGARVRQFIGVEALSGLVLLGAAALALAWANSPWAAQYFALWEYVPVPGLTAHARPVPLRLWINDGLMSIFFFVVGLEIRREMHNGALCNLKLATLPLLAAIGGVAAPALIYMYFNQAPLARGGWAVPTATDIAFAVGVLALLGKRVPNALRVLLLAIAIIDDIIAVLIIAFFYADGIALRGVAIALAGCALVLLIQRTGQRKPMDFGVPALIIWYGLLRRPHPSRDCRRGVGAVDADARPVRQPGRAPRSGAASVGGAYGVMPVFAFANAGVSLGSGRQPHEQRDAGGGRRPGAGQAAGHPACHPRGARRALLRTAGGRRVARPGGAGHARRHRFHDGDLRRQPRLSVRRHAGRSQARGDERVAAGGDPRPQRRLPASAAPHRSAVGANSFAH